MHDLRGGMHELRSAMRDELRQVARDWRIALLAVIIASGLATGGLILQASANQLAAFQAGLASVQSVVAVSAAAPSGAAAAKAGK